MTDVERVDAVVRAFALDEGGVSRGEVAMAINQQRHHIFILKDLTPYPDPLSVSFMPQTLEPAEQ